MSDSSEPREDPATSQSDTPTIHQNFLSRHMPTQLSNSRKLCYRHRPDLTRRRMPDSFNFKNVQQQMETLPTEDRAAITHIWSLFSAAPADQRLLILKGVLSACCMPQLSFLYDEIKPLLRIDFVSILPREISLKIFTYLDAKSLCHAAQVSQTWRSLADDDALWQRMCEQHIDKKCTKCGWGLPLLGKRRLSAGMQKRRIESNPRPTGDSPLRTACGPSESLSSPEIHKRPKTESSVPVAMLKDDLYPDSTAVESTVRRRPWKDVYSERLVVERNWRRNEYNMRVLRGHTDGVMCIQFCDSNNVVMTGSYDKTVRIWDLETGDEIRMLTGHTQCVRALQFDDAKLVTGAMDSTLKIWDWHSGRCIRTLEGHSGGVLSLHFDCRILASGSTDATVRVWNFQAGECYTLTGHTEWVNCVRICPQENMLLSSSDDCTIRLWNVQTRTCISTFTGHVGQVQMALPSPKGFKHRVSELSVGHPTSHLTNGGIQGATQNRLGHPPACATPTGGSLQTAQARSDVNQLPGELSERPIVVSAGLDNTIRIWDLESGHCLRTLFGHVEGIWGLAFDSLRIVSGSHDKTIRIWDMECGRCMHALEGHNGPVTAVALSDTKIISASDDGDVRIWDYGVKH